MCRYQNQWYVASNMWGADLQQKLKAKILAKTGAPDPDHLKYTEPDALEWAQGAEQQAAQMYKKYIRYNVSIT